MKKLLKLKNIYYLSTGLIAIFVGLVGGVIDIIQPETLVQTAKHLGYSLEFFYLLGIFKILGAIALFLPFDKIKDLAYAGFMFDFIFASYSHYVVQDSILKITLPLVFLGILIFSYILKELIKMQRKESSFKGNQH